MSDWQPGDLALCVKRGEWNEVRRGILTSIPSSGPKGGAILTVRAVEISMCQWLRFVEWPGEDAYARFDSTRFRKIHPLSIEERNAEIRLLTGKPVKVGA